MPREFVNPNLHVILIHYPLALLSMGAIIELLAVFFWRRSAFRQAGRWMILIGALSMAPTATLGLYAMADVNRTAENIEEPGITWLEVREQSPIQGHEWEMMTRHAWLNAAGSAVMLMLVVVWLASSDAWRQRVHLIFLLVLIVGLGLTVWGSWHGGEMVYRHGVGVEEEPAPQIVEDSDAPPAVKAHADWRERTAYFLPPLQIHVILAGATVALALAALGMSLRQAAQPHFESEAHQYDDEIAGAFNPPRPRPEAPGFESPEVAIARPTRPPRSRFWLLATLLGVVTAVTGWWTLAYYSDTWTVQGLWEMVLPQNNDDSYRRMVHFLTGGGIVVLLLVLAIIARFSLGRRLIISIFALLLLAAVVAQIWFGSLLMFDSNMGPLGRFNGTESPEADASDAGPLIIEPPATTTTAPTD